MKKKSKIIPIILCGGSGTRLWPKSRTSLPKQYLPFDDNNLSFLQLTLERIKEIDNIDNPIVICNQEHRFITAEQLRQINVKAKSIILEPIRKNTCPAVALGAIRALEFDEESILLILPSDHLIKNNKAFIKIIEEAEKYTDKESLITFGIIPDGPETGYGYIKSSSLFNVENINCLTVEKFIEKPNIKLAEEFIKDKRFTWNSGMFLFKAKVIVNEIEKYCPEIISSCRRALKKKINDLYFEKIDKTEFDLCPNISLDKAVMEKTKLCLVIPINIGWSDVGGWKSFWDNSKKDKNGNVLLGDVIQKYGQNNLINSEYRLVVGLGIKDLIIIETNDAVLIANRTYSEEVKTVVNELKKRSRIEVDEHRKIYRPWGNYTLIEESTLWKVKKIEVKPFSSLSLQMHNQRAEHWVVVEGNATVEIGNKILELKKNESCYVPIKTKHRLSNKKQTPLILIEVQSGSYLGEDDILRFQDDYGREKNN